MNGIQTVDRISFFVLLVPFFTWLCFCCVCVSDGLFFLAIFIITLKSLFVLLVNDSRHIYLVCLVSLHLTHFSGVESSPFVELLGKSEQETLFHLLLKSILFSQGLIKQEALGGVPSFIPIGR